MNLRPNSVLFVVKKARFSGHRQENILYNNALDTRFDQCLQGFRVLKIDPTMSCTNTALCDSMAG